MRHPTAHIRQRQRRAHTTCRHPLPGTHHHLATLGRAHTTCRHPSPGTHHLSPPCPRRQVLEPLNYLDIAIVATLTGVSEELLFRSAIIPATSPDWVGVLIAGVVFGVLHNSGGRNVAFAGWASAVGVVYGAAFLFTHNIWVVAGAHALANLSSAVAWKRGFPALSESAAGVMAAMGTSTTSLQSVQGSSETPSKQ